MVFLARAPSCTFTSCVRRAETLPVFYRLYERLDHFRGKVIAPETVELVQPEIKAGLVRIAPQEPEVLHQHKHRVELGGPEGRFLADLAEDRSASLRLVRQPIYQRVSLLQGKRHAGIGNQRIDVLLIGDPAIGT